MKKGFLIILMLVFGLSACAPSAGGQSFRLTAQAARAAASPLPSDTPLPTQTVTPIPATVTPTPLPSLTPTSSFLPLVTFAQNGICHTGPNTRYYRTGTVAAAGKKFQANARNADGSWISVQAPGVGDYCWVQLSSLDHPGDLGAVHVFDVQPLPDSPINLVASPNACGSNNLWLHWYPVYGMGYHIYRNGTALTTVYKGEFQDHQTPHPDKPTVYLYSVEAFNASGVSIPNTAEVTLCG